MAPKGSKMGDTTIFSKLNELGCYFFVLPPHFLTRWVDLNHFHIPPVTGYLTFLGLGCQNGSKRLQNGWYNHIFQTKWARMLFFVLPPHFLTSWVDLNHFHTPPVTGSLIFFCIGCHKGSKRLKNGWYNHIFQTILARMVIFCPTTPFTDQLSWFKPFPHTSSYLTFLGIGCQNGSKRLQNGW